MNWAGLAELQDQLRNLPSDLAAQANDIVVGAARQAISEMRYPDGVKNDLNKGLTVQVVSTGPFGARAIAKNTSKLAYIFESGTQVRHTEHGANRGAMPAGNVFIPAVIRNRARMYDALKAMLEKNGLKVTGNE